MVCKEDMCTGCMACVESCGRKAIFIQDTLDAFHPIIDPEKCTKCGRCRSVCPVCTPIERTHPIRWNQGWASDGLVRAKSSSGGFAQAIQRGFISNGGVVWSCAFENGQFVFSGAERLEELGKFTGSKYVKSSSKNAYAPILSALKNGRKVLFVGLPCQVAGLKKYVGSKYADRLYTVDLICHGTPSQQILRDYLKQAFDIETAQMHGIQFRRKTKFGLWGNDRKLLPSRVMDRYTGAYLNGLDYMECCYSCQFASVERVSDVTLGDSWGSEMPEDEQKKGISLALCQTEKGIELLEQADLELFPVNLEKAVTANHQLQKPSPKPAERKKLMDMLHKGVSFRRAVFWTDPMRWLKQDIKLVLTKMGLLR